MHELTKIAIGYAILIIVLAGGFWFACRLLYRSTFTLNEQIERPRRAALDAHEQQAAAEHDWMERTRRKCGVL